MAGVSNKEKAEGNQVGAFLRLFNQKYKVDYDLGPVEVQNSIIDRRGISQSGRWPELKVQIKDIKKRDTSPFTQSIMGKETLVFDVNVFTHLTPTIRNIEEGYRGGAKGIVLVLIVGVSEDWMKDYPIPSEIIGQTDFEGIYCLGLPSNISPSGYIFPLKEIALVSK
jgi:hypothetical protein